MAAVKSAAPPVPAGPPDYGLDAPHQFRSMLWRGGMLLALGIGFLVMNQGDASRGGIAMFAILGCIGLGFLGTAALMRYTSRVTKLQIRDEMLDALPWRGDEKVLDVGCGRGLLAIGAAKRLRNGKVTGIDCWSAEDLSGNDSAAPMANAKAEGVAERLKIETGDARRLPYQPNSFDTVVSSLAIHNIRDDNERGKAVLELLRVTKPGGVIAVFDILNANDYMRLLEQSGAEIERKSDRKFLGYVPARWFVARKRA
jgi:SAM-dependent methyltransferase